MGYKNSLLAQNSIKNNHEIDVSDMRIVDRCSQWSQRLFLEAWHSIRKPTGISDPLHVPDIDKFLANPK